MQSILTLLKLLTKKFTPPSNSHHYITYYDDDKLILTLFLNNFVWQQFTISKDDFDKSPEDLLKEIETLLENMKEK